MEHLPEGVELGWKVAIENPERLRRCVERDQADGAEFSIGHDYEIVRVPDLVTDNRSEFCGPQRSRTRGR